MLTEELQDYKTEEQEVQEVQIERANSELLSNLMNCSTMIYSRCVDHTYACDQRALVFLFLDLLA